MLTIIHYLEENLFVKLAFCLQPVYNNQRSDCRSKNMSILVTIDVHLKLLRFSMYFLCWIIIIRFYNSSFLCFLRCRPKKALRVVASLRLTKLLSSKLSFLIVAEFLSSHYNTHTELISHLNTEHKELPSSELATQTGCIQILL